MVMHDHRVMVATYLRPLHLAQHLPVLTSRGATVIMSSQAHVAVLS